MTRQLIIAESRHRRLARAIIYRTLALISSFSMVVAAAGILAVISKTVIYLVIKRGRLYVNWQLVYGRKSESRVWTEAIVCRTIATVAVGYWDRKESALILTIIRTLLFYFNEVICKQVEWQG